MDAATMRAQAIARHPSTGSRLALRGVGSPLAPDATEASPPRPLPGRLVRLIILTAVLLTVVATGASALRQVVAPPHHRSTVLTRVHASRSART